MPPRPGSKIEFVSKHLGLSNAELIAKAKEAGVELTPAVLDATRWTLRTKYGFKNSGSKPKKHKKKYKARALKASKNEPPKQKRKYTRRADKESTNGASPDRKLKHAAVRKLFFEIGYDDAEKIFLEFQEMHNRQWS